MKPRKPISHFERTHYVSCAPPNIAIKPVEREVRVQTLDPATQRIHTTIEKKTFSRAEEMRPFNVSDFALENLIAIGAKLDSTTLQMDMHSEVSAMATTLANLPQPETSIE